MRSIRLADYYYREGKLVAEIKKQQENIERSKSFSSSRDPRKRQGTRQIKWFRIAIIIIMVISCWHLGKQQMLKNDLAEDITQAQQRLDEVKAHNEALKAENEKLMDDSYIEKLARENLGMTKQGEMPYIYSQDK